ncbi:MAG: hypothetical protein IJS24_09710, partial [Eubacterium sp.]|nr:hypothetical protein [Eubacterium sp.]
MRFKRNILSIIFAGVFSILMLLGFIHIMLLGYGAFEEDGFQWIFIIVAIIAILLLFIGSFLLRERAALKGIQSETGFAIVLEGFLVVGLTGLAFYFVMSTSIECRIWISAAIVLVYGICRILGGRLCGLACLIFAAAMYVLVYDSGIVAFDTKDLTDVFTFLVPFFVFLLITKYVIVQFAKKSAVVVIALIVMSAVFGTAIVMNPISVVLCLGCVISLIFTRIRSIDSVVTRGYFMAIIVLIFSGLCAFAMTMLMGKDISELISFAYSPDFEQAVNDGSIFSFLVDKGERMYEKVLYNAFDYGIYSGVLLLFSVVSGYAVIRRKLSELPPMMLSMIALIVGYIVSADPFYHMHYLTFLIPIFAAYGFYNMLLPEFLGGFEDEEEEVSPAKKAKKSKKNKKGEGIPSEDTSSGETHLGAIASGADHVVEDDLDHHSPNANPVVSVDDSHFQDWHVSAEFVREEKIRKERQDERERRYREAKAKAEAQSHGEEKQDQEVKEESKKDAAESFTFSQPTTSVETSTPSTAQTVASVAAQAAPAVAASVVAPAVAAATSVSTAEDAPQTPESAVPVENRTPGSSSPSEPIQPAETSTSTISAAYPSIGSESVDSPGRVVFVQEDVGHYVAPNLPEFDETLTPLPESARKENTLLNADSAQDDSEMAKSLEINAKYEGREMELQESFRRDTDSIVMSGYQNDPGTFGSDDILATYDQMPFSAETQSFAPLGEVYSGTVVDAPVVETTDTVESIPVAEPIAEAVEAVSGDTSNAISFEAVSDTSSEPESDMLSVATPEGTTSDDKIDVAETATDETSGFEFDMTPRDEFEFSYSDVQEEIAEEVQPPEAHPEMELDIQSQEAVYEQIQDVQPEIEPEAPVQEIDTAGILTAINETEIPSVEIPDVPSATGGSDDMIGGSSSAEMAGFSFDEVSRESAEEEKEISDRLSEAAANFKVDEDATLSSGADDEQLNTFLDRLDMSDSIKRMNKSAREDMADVIEQEKDQEEDEVVLHNEDYNFGDDSEYGQVPTISDLEDKWRMEQELNKTPESDIPDVVSAASSAADTSGFMPFDDVRGSGDEKSDVMQQVPETSAAKTEDKPTIIPFEPEVIKRMKPEPIEDTEEEFEEDISEDVSSKITTSEVDAAGFHGISFKVLAREQEPEPVHVTNRID